jgi:hypothetical protein
LTEDENGFRYTYDHQNHLIQIDELRGQIVYYTRATYDYDALGRRIQKTEYDTSGQPLSNAINYYYYDGQRVLAEYSVAPGSGQTGSSVIRFFVDGPTYIDEHLMMFDRVTNEKYYYLDQELHTVAALVDSQLNVAESATYDAYGKATIRNASNTPVDESPIGNPYYFTSRRRDHLTAWFSPNDLNQYHYRARTYSPTHGRILRRL